MRISASIIKYQEPGGIEPLLQIPDSLPDSPVKNDPSMKFATHTNQQCVELESIARWNSTARVSPAYPGYRTQR